MFVFFIDNIPIYHPDVGLIVKVYSQKMKMFCRARIININSYTDINVFHIDYGFYENLPLSNIFELDKNLKVFIVSIHYITISILP